MSVRFVLATMLFTVATLTATGSVYAITFGQPDGDQHPHVGTLVFMQNGTGYYSCTGTLISPTVMLTAGHCVEEGGVKNSITYVRFTEHARQGRENYPSTQAWLDAVWIHAKDVIPHPDFDDFADFSNTFDVGLVILPNPVIYNVYGMLPPKGFLEDVKAQKGNLNNWWTAVGYGDQGVINPFEGDDYSRYQTITRLIELTSKYTGPGSNAKFTNNPGNDTGGTCFGDSGGPVFYQDTPIIGAIVSWGKTPCIGVDYQFRIDTDTALNFIKTNMPP